MKWRVLYGIITCVIIINLLFMRFTQIRSLEFNKARSIDFIKHDPLYIDSNNDLNELGFPGSGLATDPFIIENLNITSTTNTLIFIKNTNVNLIIRNCVLNALNRSQIGIYLQGVEYCTIENNDISNSKQVIIIESSRINTIHNNVINYIHDQGINLAHSSRNIVRYNAIFNTTLLQGIRLYEAQDNHILFNDVSSCYANGIEITRSFNNTIKNNTLYGNNENGIWLDSSNDQKIEGNIIKNNNENGILLQAQWYGSDQNNFSYNIIEQNKKYAILIESSDKNLFTWNSFINNNLGGSSQANDSGYNNIFELNYWNDWTSPDNDGDGIVDIPYSIDGKTNNSDSYPLVLFKKKTTTDSTSIPSLSPGFSSYLIILGMIMITVITKRKR